MNLDFENETVYYQKEKKEKKEKQEKVAFSLNDLQFCPGSPQLFELWIRFENSKANTKAERATTQDSESSFVNSSEDGNGSDTSESRESYASDFSSGDSAVVEESDVAPALAEAIKNNDGGAVKLMNKKYVKQIERFHKDIQTDHFHRWHNLQMKKEAWKIRQLKRSVKGRNR